MATLNPFDLLGDDDNDDPSVLLAAQQHKVAAAVAATTKKSNPAATQPAKAAAKLPTKPLPPSQAVREARSDGGRGGRGGGRGYGRSRGGFNRDYGNTENSYGNDSGAPRSYEGGDSGRNSERRPFTGTRGGSRGGRRGGFNNGEMTDGERPRRTYDRQSGTGRSNDFKRDGAGRGNWGTATDEIAQESNEVAIENETNVAAEKPVNEENSEAKENSANETEEKEEEEKQMTLEEYEKVLEEKRKALQAMKVEERKVDAKEFESMQMIAKKKSEEDIVFIKLGSDKDKRKEAADKEERAKKSLSINEFLKPSEGESFYRSGGRGRGRGRGGPRGGGGGYGGRGYGDAPAPAIADPGQFPSLGGK